MEPWSCCLIKWRFQKFPSSSTPNELFGKFKFPNTCRWKAEMPVLCAYRSVSPMHITGSRPQPMHNPMSKSSSKHPFCLLVLITATAEFTVKGFTLTINEASFRHCINSQAPTWHNLQKSLFGFLKSNLNFLLWIFIVFVFYKNIFSDLKRGE